MPEALFVQGTVKANILYASVATSINECTALSTLYCTIDQLEDRKSCVISLTSQAEIEYWKVKNHKVRRSTK